MLNLFLFWGLETNATEIFEKEICWKNTKTILRILVKVENSAYWDAGVLVLWVWQAKSTTPWTDWAYTQVVSKDKCCKPVNPTNLFFFLFFSSVKRLRPPYFFVLKYLFTLQLFVRVLTTLLLLREFIFKTQYHILYIVLFMVSPETRLVAHPGHESLIMVYKKVSLKIISWHENLQWLDLFSVISTPSSSFFLFFNIYFLNKN